ncbi:MAG: sodium:solute symporter family protein [Phycisphaerales bacterium]
MGSSLNWIDWLVIALLLGITVSIGLYFTRRAGKDINSFFVSERALPWYLSGSSMIATSFAADTPLWVSALIRQYGVYYVWQYWAPVIGAGLAIVLFARLWRRMGVLTDIEFIECRYSGKFAGTLRFWSGTSSALIFCPLIIGWVTKAMETISRETMGLPSEYKIWTTIIVVCVALTMCTLSGLWGIVYADFFLFIIATAGTTTLAILSIHHVGGLHAMVEKLSSMHGWAGHNLNIAPSIGSNAAQMSIWNAIGYFGILWIMVAVSGGYQAQRLLACKDGRHATFAIMMHSIIYYGIVCWPWIIVGLCSLIVIPELGHGITNDSAYPRMIITILPIGLRGLLVAALLAAFISTISTMFNWGASYLVNDVYKRFIVKKGSTKHYIWIARIATVMMAAGGGLISFFAHDIQQLLTIFYVVGSGMIVVSVMRWFWWRLNAAGDLAATLAAWIIAPLLLFAKIFDVPARIIFNLDREIEFSSDPNLVGARMLFMTISITAIAVVVSYLTKPTDLERLKDFVHRARPFKLFWKPVVGQMQIEYCEYEGLGRTLVSWIFSAGCIITLIFGIGKLLLGHPLTGVCLLCVFGILLYITVQRINKDFLNERIIDAGDVKKLSKKEIITIK